jgi:hypothetical protein
MLTDMGVNVIQSVKKNLQPPGDSYCVSEDRHIRACAESIKFTRNICDWYDMGKETHP